MGPLGVSAAPEGLLAEVWTLHSPGSCPASSLPLRGGRPCYAPSLSLGLCAVVAAPTKLEGASFSPRAVAPPESLRGGQTLGTRHSIPRETIPSGSIARSFPNSFLHLPQNLTGSLRQDLAPSPPTPRQTRTIRGGKKVKKDHLSPQLTPK